MASPKEVAPLLPDTLPDDFGDWDGSSSPARPSATSEWDTAFDESGPAKPSKPAERSDDRDALLASLMDKQRMSRSSSSAVKPNDFVNWEREAPPAPLREKPRVREAVPPRSDPSKAIVKHGPPPAAKPVESWPPVSEPAFAKPGDSQNGSASHASSKAVSDAPAASSRPSSAPSRELTATEMRKADETLYQLFSSKGAEVKAESKAPSKKWMIFAAAGAGVILVPVILIFTLGHHGAKAASKPSTTPLTVATDSGAQTGAPGDASASAKPDASKKQQAADQTANPGDANSQNGLTQKQAKAMSEQLNAPRVISQGRMAENAPPPNIGAEGLAGGGGMGSVFNSQGQSVKVTSSKGLVISSGIANGMLIQKTPPVYPPIARTARVSGTVDLHATISKTGSIKDLYVVSGPTMLRQAALDAVRNWRYRPYTLNDQPTEVETTIAVVFSLNN